MGDFETWSLDQVESSLEYHPCYIEVLTVGRYPAIEQRQVGSLTGAVAS